MKLIIKDKTYTLTTEDSKTLREIEGMLPLTMTFRRNHDVEFVGDLPAKPVNDARPVSHIEPKGIYYYEGWNVFCLNYREGDISPYHVSYLGKADDPALSEVLEKAEETLVATIE